jgi:hypothetical protein
LTGVLYDESEASMLFIATYDDLLDDVTLRNLGIGKRPAFMKPQASY